MSHARWLRSFLGVSWGGDTTFCRIPPDGVKPTNPVIFVSKARYGRSVWIITLTVCALIIAIAVNTLYVSLTNNNVEVGVLTALLCLGLLVVPYLFSPRAFELTRNGIVVRRILRSFEIPYSKIRKAYLADLSWKRIRLWASGGLYGFYGLFYVARLGKVWVYATRRCNLVVIETEGNKYAISPEDPEEFLEMLKKFVPSVPQSPSKA